MKELKELLKNYRVEELAAKIGCAASSVWGWKAGRKPSRMAEEKILRLHKEVFDKKLTKVRIKS